jgi:hypothetical protein
VSGYKGPTGPPGVMAPDEPADGTRRRLADPRVRRSRPCHRTYSTRRRSRTERAPARQAPPLPGSVCTRSAACPGSGNTQEPLDRWWPDAPHRPDDVCGLLATCHAVPLWQARNEARPDRAPARRRGRSGTSMPVNHLRGATRRGRRGVPRRPRLRCGSCIFFTYSRRPARVACPTRSSPQALGGRTRLRLHVRVLPVVPSLTRGSRPA